MSALIATAGEGTAGPVRAAQAAAALRRNAVAALGELLFYIVTQEPVGAGSGGGGLETERWNIPVAAVAGVIGNCLLVVDDPSGGGGGGDGGGRLAGHEGARHYAAKTMENVLAQVGPSHPLVPALVTPELALGLLDLARHASSENLRCTAAAALYHVFGHDILGGEFSQDCDDHDDDDEIEASRSIGSESASRGARRGARRRRSDRDGDDVPAAGRVASRVMREPGAPEFIVQGLSAEGNSTTSRRAFLGMFNLVVWASGNCGGDWAVGGGRTEDEEFDGRGRRNPPLFLRGAVECMLESQHLLLRLLRVAEHGEDTVLRAKGFLSLRLTLEEAADPGFLLKACRSRLLPLLARAIGGLAPRSAPRCPAAPATAAAAAAAGMPELSPQQEYLYECSTLLAEWLCAVPETAARRLATELQQRRGVSAGGDGVSATTARDGCDAAGRWGRQPERSGGHGSGGGAPPRQFGAGQQAAAAGTAELEAAMGMFPAVVHLVNSPLLREQAVTRPFVSDVAGCLALSCPTLGVAAAGTGGGNGGGGGGGGSSGRSSGRRAVSPAAGGPWSGGGGGDGSVAAVVLAALLPTVETLAQQAELVLVPHQDVVSVELIPVLCRFLRSPSGDTRALVVAIFRVLLPPLVRTQQQQQQSGTQPPPPPARPQQQRLGGPAEVAGRPSSSSSSPATAEDLVRSAFADHLLPHAASLLGDHDPIPQYTIRLLLDVGRAWGGLGTALLCSGRDDAAAAAVAAALLDRLSGTPLSAAPSPRGVTRTGHEPPGDAAAVTTLDPALACLLSLLVDDGAGTTGAGPGRGLPSDRRRRQHVAGTGHYDGDDSYHGGNDDVFVALLGLELPRRTAAAVAAAVKAGAPEAADACLGLAVALLDAGARRKAAAEALLGPLSGTERATAAVAAATASACRGAGAGAAAVFAGEQWEEQQLRPLLAAVPLAVEAVNLFCVQGALAEMRREHQLAGAPVRGRKGPGGALGGVDDGVRSGVSDSATLFLEVCFKTYLRRRMVTCVRSLCADSVFLTHDGHSQVHFSFAMFGESLLRSLLLAGPVRRTSSVSGSEPLPSLASGHAAAATPQARVFRQLADFVACPAEDERPRIRVLRLLLNAVSTLGQPFCGALRRGPLWTALLRLATGRGIGSGREAVLVAGVGGSGARTALGETSSLARDVVAAVREDRGYNGPVAAAEPRGWSGRSGSSRGGRR
ncbi:unnamed protein product [Ectocarpus sp. 12 AP-2014]